jgi:site-specific recombinase XerD
MSERRAPISVDGFQKMVERLSVRAKLGFPVHAHMLRHACGFKMANDGVDTRTTATQGWANWSKSARPAPRKIAASRSTR